MQVAATTGEAAAAREAADELHTIAARYASAALQASADLAAGRAALLDDDPRAAVHPLERAVATWVDVGSPHEAAVARMVLGQAHHRAGNDAAARLEWDAAAAAFDRAGSHLWSDRLTALRDGDESTGPRPAGPDPGRPDPGGTDRGSDDAPADDERHVFRCDGDVRTIAFADEQVLLSDLKGMRYLERLLAEPDREFHVLDLVVAESGETPADLPAEDTDAVTRGGDAGVLVDDQARAAYRRRLVEIEADIDEATRMNDPERRALAEADREYLVAELARATGLGGRRRRAGSASERARSSVTRTLRYAIDRIDEHHAALGRHLDRTVRTGTYCSYRPDPRTPVRWEI